MSKFPSGPFTIVNQETGRCLRVRLGETTNFGGDFKEGTEYLLSRTDPPVLELGPADGTMATRWYYRYHNDSLERQPFNQIASTAVSELQNIGDYCVWMYSDAMAEEYETQALCERFAALLNDASAEVAKRLDALISKEWSAKAAEDYDAELAAWKKDGEFFEGELAGFNSRQARLLVTLRSEHAEVLEAVKEHAEALAEQKTEAGKKYGNKPLTKEKLVEDAEYWLLRGTKQVQVLEEAMVWAEPKDQSRLLTEQLEAMEFSGAAILTPMLDGLDLTPRLQRAMAQAKSTEEGLVQALEMEAPLRAWQRRPPLKGVARWNDSCARLAFRGADALDGTGKKFADAMRAYLAAAAKEGIAKPVAKHGSRTQMFGCGAKRYGGSTYRWDYDGTYITASDSQTVPWEKTYWTDDGGRLVGKAKGGPGQKWTIAAYKKPAKTEQTDIADIFLTGMFGPLAAILRRA
ncbi:hypothetical protein ACFY5K_36415 [Streptomyces griseofuscus]|uniref:hypothetical protein n=1 Tax=Streptomyces griseofuscus TaxID=146922 RepID=UPI003689553F